MSETSSSVAWVLGQGRYEVKRKLGEGGMAFALLALDKTLGADVVLKVPKPAMMADPEFARRFKREIRSMQELTHEHIVKIKDVGEHDGMPFYVMDLLAGGSLQDRIEGGPNRQAQPMPSAALNEWLEPVAAALDFIHQRFVHRDIKPANILFDAYGHAFVGDFGIVKAIADGNQAKQTVMTQAGMAIGTPWYMAPELTEGKKIDGRADQFALAVTVYQALSGRVPFEGTTIIEVLRRQLLGQIAPLHALVPGLPKALTLAVEKGLSQDPDGRYATCTAFAKAVLATVKTGAAVGKPRMPSAVCPSCRTPFPLPADPAGKSVSCPACKATFTVTRKSAKKTVPAAPTLKNDRAGIPVATRAAPLAQRAVPPTWLEDRGTAGPRKPKPVKGGSKRWMALLLTAAGTIFVSVAVLGLLAFWPTRTPRPPEKDKKAETADGPFLSVKDYDLTGGYRFVHFGKDGDIRAVVRLNDFTAIKYEAWVVDPSTEKKTAGPLTHQDLVYHAAFSPDGTRVVTASRDETAVVWDARTGQKIAGPLTHQDPVWHAAFSPDGTRVVTASLDKTAVVWDARTGQKIAGPLTHQASVRHAAFSPDGTRVVTASYEKTAMVWDARTGQKIAGPLTHQDPVWHATFSPDGTRVVTASRDETAMVWDARTGQKIAGPLTHQDPVYHATFSPDGTRVVTASLDTTAVVWDARTGQKIAGPLTHQNSVLHAAFSPDGTRVVTASDDKTAVVWDARTGQKIAGPLTHQKWVLHAAFSPDGTRVVTSASSETVVVWDARSGEKLGAASAK